MRGAAEGLEVAGLKEGLIVTGTGTAEGLAATGRPVTGGREGWMELIGLRVGGAMGELELCTVVET